MGLSHDSRYLVCHLRRPLLQDAMHAATVAAESDDEDGEDVDVLLGTNACNQAVVVFEVTPRCLRRVRNAVVRVAL
jgi:hypothetical protein